MVCFPAFNGRSMLAMGSINGDGFDELTSVVRLEGGKINNPFAPIVAPFSQFLPLDVVYDSHKDGNPTPFNSMVAGLLVLLNKITETLFVESFKNAIAGIPVVVAATLTAPGRINL